MIVLDTDHLTVLKYPEGDMYAHLVSRMNLSEDQAFGITIVTVEEQFRGWLAAIARERQVREQVHGYEELVRLFGFLSGWSLIPFTEQAAHQFERLRKSKVRIGTMDLKIAAIALVHHALLLTANRQDFEQVPGLRFENWLM